MLTADRLDEYASVTTLIARWALAQDDVVGAAVVGSWARGAARMDSDIDIVVLTTDKARYLDDDQWVAIVLGESAPIITTQDWGPVTERRVRLSSGLEVEFGFVTPSWATTDPVDPDTARVVRDGCKPLEDSGAVFERLIASLS
jgi:predicted nucleotidyltransferase